jgi:hypothetical protein
LGKEKWEQNKETENKRINKWKQWRDKDRKQIQRHRKKEDKKDDQLDDTTQDDYKRCGVLRKTRSTVTFRSCQNDG